MSPLKSLVNEIKDELTECYGDYFKSKEKKKYNLSDLEDDDYPYGNERAWDSDENSAGDEYESNDEYKNSESSPTQPSTLLDNSLNE
jgi:hypothetical protein